MGSVSAPFLEIDSYVAHVDVCHSADKWDYPHAFIEAMDFDTNRLD